MQREFLQHSWKTTAMSEAGARDSLAAQGTTCDMVALWQNDVRTRTGRFSK